MAETKTSSLLGMDREELTALVIEAGEPGYRAKQMMDAVYRQRVESLAEISTLPQEFRERLERNGVTVGAARIDNKFMSGDGTVRYLIAFADGQSVETVWMPEGDGGGAGGGIGGQICAVLKDQKVSPPEDRINLVFMGMGEPFLNYENFVKAGRLLVEGVGIAERRMTVSTAGIVPRIHENQV